MLNIVSILLNFVFTAIKYLLGFLVTLILGVVGAALYVLPWLLRAATALLWLGGAYIGFITIQTIYAPFSPAIPVLALQFSVILISVGWVTIVMGKNTNFVWGGMAAVGLVVGGASIGSIWLLDHWQHADLFFRVLPPAMFAVLLMYETIHLRSLRRDQTDKEIIDDTEENTAQ